MNRFEGIIRKTEQAEQFLLVVVDVGELAFTGILLQGQGSALALQEGMKIVVFFNPTELFLARNLKGQISIRNRFKGNVKHVEKGPLLSKVTLDCGTLELVSLITTQSAEMLGAAPGVELEALLKTNEVMFELK